MNIQNLILDVPSVEESGDFYVSLMVSKTRTRRVSYCGLITKLLRLPPGL